MCVKSRGGMGERKKNPNLKEKQQPEWNKREM